MPTTRGLYESVTNHLVSELEKGVRPWTRPWTNAPANVVLVPTNAASGRPYSGMNIVLLWDAAHQRGFTHHGWMTFRQANQLGGRVRKNEKATTVVYTKFTPKAVEGQELPKMVPMAKAYSVFNLSQLDGLPASYYAPPEPWPEEQRMDALKRLVEASGIRVEYGAAQAAYYPQPDRVAMPAYTTFKSDDDFASTLGHELAHATGHPSRLNRRFNSKVFKEAYAVEECVAELTSVFLAAHLGFSYIEANSPAYLDHWLKVMKQDARAIFSIASYASHAADWLREREHVDGDVPETPQKGGTQEAA